MLLVLLGIQWYLKKNMVFRLNGTVPSVLDCSYGSHMLTVGSDLRGWPEDTLSTPTGSQIPEVLVGWEKEDPSVTGHCGYYFFSSSPSF